MYSTDHEDRFFNEISDYESNLDTNYDVIHDPSLIDSIPNSDPILEDIITDNITGEQNSFGTELSTPLIQTSQESSQSNYQQESESEIVSEKPEVRESIDEIRGEDNIQEERKDINRIDCLQKKIIRGLKQVLIDFTNNMIKKNRKIKAIVRELRNVKSEVPCIKSSDLLKWIKKTLIDPFGLTNEEEYKEMIAQFVSIIFKTKIDYILMKFSAIELELKYKKINSNTSGKKINSKLEKAGKYPGKEEITRYCNDLKDMIEKVKVTNKFLKSDGRKFLLDHPITKMGKLLFETNIDYNKTFWKKSTERQGEVYNNLSYHKEELIKKMKEIKPINFAI